MSDLTKYAKGRRMPFEQEIKQIKQNKADLDALQGQVEEIVNNKVDKNTSDATYTSDIINTPEGIEIKNVNKSTNNYAGIKTTQSINGGINIEIGTPSAVKTNITSKLTSIELKNGTDTRNVSLKLAYTGSNNLIAKTLKDGVEKTVNIMELPDKIDEKGNKPKKFVLDYSTIDISQLPISIALTVEQKTEIENAILSEDRFNYYIEIIDVNRIYILRLYAYTLSGDIDAKFETNNKETANDVYNYYLGYSSGYISFKRTKLT